MIITLISDFGTVDGYVGEMKGVLLSRAPGVTIVDVTHDIPPQDVESARLTLARVWRRFPIGAVHLVVVDPGVGSSRAALAVDSDGHRFVGPDNGVLSPALLVPGARAIALPVPAHAAPTFHGRDVFAPAAAALAMGAALRDLGGDATAPVVRRTPEPTRTPDGSLQGEVIAIDRFGNATTNLAAVYGGTVCVGDTSLALRETYADVAAGSATALVGSSGFIEIAVRDGSAARQLGLHRGTHVSLRPA
jgi:S-adenosylmethionine hydrolase